MRNKALRTEFIGKDVKVDNIRGRIIDETKNTITLESEKKRKVLFKNNITFETKINNKTIQIKGEILTKRPEERIKG